MEVKVAGVWKSPTPYVRVAGVWKPFRQGYVRVSGTWRRFYRKPDMYYNGTVTLEYAPGNEFFGAENAAKVSSAGVQTQGITSPKTTVDGRIIGNIQTGPDASDGYPGYRWLAIMFYGNIMSLNLDIPSVTWAGQTSSAVLYSNAYISDFDITLWRFGFASTLAYSGARNFYF